MIRTNGLKTNYKPICDEVCEEIFQRIEREEKKGLCGLYHPVILVIVLDEVLPEFGRVQERNAL